MVYRFAYIQMKNYDDADDIYQEVWIRLLKQKEKIQPDEHLKAWLIKTTGSCCKDYWKSAWVKRVFLEEQRDEAAVSNPENEETGFVTACVARLPAKYRVVIHLYYYEEMSLREIAEALGRKENTVASQLARGREQLKKIMVREGDNYEF
jgi:RNA polymerase sigma-70 factor (ECF subfamily)